MLLKISTTHQPATDLGFLLHKHPDKWQTFELATGKAHVFYPEASETRCTACLLVDINPVALVRQDKGRKAFLASHYVNDRPYTSNSFMSSALVKAFGSAMNGTCHPKPELVETAMPFRVQLSALKVDCDKAYLSDLFALLGYTISIETMPLDATFPTWGESKVVNLHLEKTTTLKMLLSQLYVLIMVLDNERHYWISTQDIDVLMRRGADWLAQHPEKEWIMRRYLKNIRPLMNEAVVRLAEEVDSESIEEVSEKKQSLHQQRLHKVAMLLKETGAEQVLDMGCGEGKLMKILLQDGQFRRIAGMDVSFSELQKAKQQLHLDQASPAMKERVQLFQSSVVYTDDRMKNFEAVALVEVIEHLDEERLSSLKDVVFGFAMPQYVVISTPNAEYNVRYETLAQDHFRHNDHRFEWTRAEFAQWCDEVCQQFGYEVVFHALGEEDAEVGAPSQIAVFTRK